MQCRVSWLFCVKDFSHSSHLNGREPVWDLMCRLRWPFCVNAFGHILHANGRPPEWVREWTRSSLLLANAFGHILHAQGFSPVCLRLWITRLQARAQLYSQSSCVHLNRFSAPSEAGSCDLRFISSICRVTNLGWFWFNPCNKNVVVFMKRLHIIYPTYRIM